MSAIRTAAQAHKYASAVSNHPQPPADFVRAKERLEMRSPSTARRMRVRRRLIIAISMGAGVLAGVALAVVTTA